MVWGVRRNGVNETKDRAAAHSKNAVLATGNAIKLLRTGAAAAAAGATQRCLLQSRHRLRGHALILDVKPTTHRGQGQPTAKRALSGPSTNGP